jgi:hypothetical protein
MAKVTFDGPNKLIIVDNAITSIDVEVDLYSDWKEWMLVSDNSKYLQAFRAVGGDDLVGGQTVSGYFFLMNGWRVRPYEGDHMLVVDGNLFVDGGGNPFVPTVGNYNVLVNLQTSVNAVTSLVSSGSDGNGGMELTDVVEGSLTVEEMFRLLIAVNLNKSSGGGTSSIKFRDLADSKDRVVATVDPNTGDRQGVSVDGS